MKSLRDFQQPRFDDDLLKLGQKLAQALISPIQTSSMAVLGDSAYFPPLDQCLDGDLQLLSWKEAFLGILGVCATTPGPGKNSLKNYFNDDCTVEILTHFLSPFPPPTPQTRAAFDDLTSAIHITPNSGGRYSVKEIKEDTLWLSKEVGIDEVSSLRIVIIEWQSQPATWLSNASADNDKRGMRGLTEGSSLQLSLYGSNYGLSPSLADSGNDISTDFISSQKRRIRLLEIYLSERQYLSKIVQFIVFVTLNKPGQVDSSQGSVEVHDDVSWLEAVGATVLKSWNLNGIYLGNENNWLTDAISGLKLRIENLGKGSGWLQEEDTAVDVEQAWCRVQLMEIIHIMQTILDITISSTELTKADVVQSWYRFVGEFGFFEQFESPFQELVDDCKFPFQSLIALISLAILNVPIAIKTLAEIESSVVAPNSSDDVSYLLSGAVVELVNEVLTEAAWASSSIASPAVLAWAVILQDVRQYADSSKEHRELSQSQRAVDSFGASRDSGTERGESSSAQRRPSPHRRPSFGSDSSQQMTYLEEVLEMIKRSAPNEDVITLLARSSIDQAHVFDIVAKLATEFCVSYGSEHAGKPGRKVRTVLLGLIAATLEWVDYQPETVQATLGVLSESYPDNMQRPPKSIRPDPAAVFLKEPLLMSRIFDVALSRFPYEMIPFLKLCTALATSHTQGNDVNNLLVPLLSSMHSFTCSLPRGFQDFEETLGPDFAYLKLKSGISMFAGLQTPRQQKSLNSNSKAIVESGRSTHPDWFQLPEETVGRELGTSKPPVVLWRHDYSAFEYLGHYLQIVNSGKMLQEGPGPESTREIVTEIIALLTAIISPVVYSEHYEWPILNARDLAQTVLEITSDGLSRNEDIVSLIFAIFEIELHTNHSPSRKEEPTRLLVQCINFTHALLSVYPGRVWPFLGRSGLLGLDGTEGQIARVIATSETITGNYDFLNGCIQLFEVMLTEALTHVAFRNQHQNVQTRFEELNSDVVGIGISDVTMKKILQCMGRLLMDILESCRSWRFTSPFHLMKINTGICHVFETILMLCYGIDDNPEISQKISGFLAPAADYLLDVLLPNTAVGSPIQPLLQMLVDGLENPSSTLPTKDSEHWVMQTNGSIKLLTTLVRISHFQRLPNRTVEHLFKSTPVLAKLYATHAQYRLPVVELFEALVCAAGTSNKQVPSMLGHMGQGIAKPFLDMLTILDKPLDEDALSIGIWRLLSAVVSQRQQWFAIYTLTGSTPRDSLNDRSSATGTASHNLRPMLGIAANRLCDIQNLPAEVALSMLEFLALATEFWPWVMPELLSNPYLFSALLGFLDRRNRGISNVEDFDATRTQMASLIVNIFAMGVYHSTQGRETSFPDDVLVHLIKFVRFGVASPSYNSSLHGSLSKNFEARFPGYRLANFKRTSLNRSRFGESFFYNLEYASIVLGYHPSWDPKDGQGFAREFVRANINLSIVEAQVNLFQSWKTLLIQLISSFGEDEDFNLSLTGVIRRCLESNLDRPPLQPILQQIHESRADLAFALIQRVVEVIPHTIEAKSLLKPAWNTLRSHTSDIGLALSSSEADYTRTLLKTVYLAVQMHQIHLSTTIPDSEYYTGSPKAIEVTQLTLEILAIVVAQGFRSLTTLLLDDSSRVLPADFAIINAILRASLHVPGVERHPEQLVTIFTDDGTARSACTLLSWSHQLMIDNNDPIYGELSMAFLTELSSAPGLAESIATSGILSQISSTTLMQYFRRPGGIGQFNEPKIMYGIWTRSVLPLALNLLGEVGAPVAAEVAAFINQFEGQLTRAANAFDFKSISTPPEPGSFYITLATASEVHSLALLVSILDTFREAGSSAGIVASDVTRVAWDRQQVKEDLESWLQRRNSLRDCIVATSEKEEAWARQQPLNKDSGAENRLEEKVLEEMNAALLILGEGER